MATTVGVLRAIGIVVLAPVYYDSPITLDDLMLLSKIDIEKWLKSKIEREVELKSKITLT